MNDHGDDHYGDRTGDVTTMTGGVFNRRYVAFKVVSMVVVVVVGMVVVMVEVQFFQ